MLKFCFFHFRGRDREIKKTGCRYVNGAGTGNSNTVMEIFLSKLAKIDCLEGGFFESVSESV